MAGGERRALYPPRVKNQAPRSVEVAYLQARRDKVSHQGKKTCVYAFRHLFLGLPVLGTYLD